MSYMQALTSVHASHICTPGEGHRDAADDKQTIGAEEAGESAEGAEEGGAAKWSQKGGSCILRTVTSHIMHACTRRIRGGYRAYTALTVG